MRKPRIITATKPLFSLTGTFLSISLVNTLFGIVSVMKNEMKKPIRYITPDRRKIILKA
ncbi:unnamed protein product [marine sediment metagenome]|uniref:Uncharacterized protein n=1 Tax=marine sediment metagenome TaxID=412755 RepID=X1BS58_9ZZZZ